MALHPDQLSMRDDDGRLPLHRVSYRGLQRQEPSDDTGSGGININSPPFAFGGNNREGGGLFEAVALQGAIDSNNNNNISDDDSNLAYCNDETLKLTREVLEASSDMAPRTYDGERRLPLHCAVDAVVSSLLASAVVIRRRSSISSALPSPPDAGDYNDDNLRRRLPLMNPFQAAMPLIQQRRSQRREQTTHDRCHRATRTAVAILSELVRANPEALGRRDGRTMLYPFMQAASAATAKTAAVMMVTDDVYADDEEEEEEGEHAVDGDDDSFRPSFRRHSTSRPSTTLNGVVKRHEGSEIEHLSIVYYLLRENPSIATLEHQNQQQNQQQHQRTASGGFAVIPM